MKKLVSFALLLGMVITMSACGESELTQRDITNLVSSSTSSTQTTESTGTSKTQILNSKFKSAMDSYEKFMDDYIAFMKKYKANPTDLSLLSNYTDYLSKYADFVEDFGEWQNQNLSSAELAYYLDVQARVSKKLLEVTQ